MAEKIRPISGFANHPIDLFGPKAESENLLSLIESVTGLKYCDGDAFLRRICTNFLQSNRKPSQVNAITLSRPNEN